MGDVMEATVNLPGGWQKGTLREVDPDDEQIRGWVATGWVVKPKGGQRAARKTLAEEAPEEGSVAQQGIDDQPSGSLTPAAATTTTTTGTGTTTGATGTGAAGAGPTPGKARTRGGGTS